jgi:hypothetical protein
MSFTLLIYQHYLIMCISVLINIQRWNHCRVLLSIYYSCKLDCWRWNLTWAVLQRFFWFSMIFRLNESPCLGRIHTSEEVVHAPLSLFSAYTKLYSLTHATSQTKHSWWNGVLLLHQVTLPWFQHRSSLFEHMFFNWEYVPHQANTWNALWYRITHIVSQLHSKPAKATSELHYVFTKAIVPNPFQRVYIVFEPLSHRRQCSKFSMNPRRKPVNHSPCCLVPMPVTNPAFPAKLLLLPGTWRLLLHALGVLTSGGRPSLCNAPAEPLHLDVWAVIVSRAHSIFLPLSLSLPLPSSLQELWHAAPSGQLATPFLAS